jgi:hypothetical protein
LGRIGSARETGWVGILALEFEDLHMNSMDQDELGVNIG